MSDMTKRSETSIPGIYLITNTLTGVVYVGQARNIRKRWEIHRSTLKSKSHRNCYLQRAWDKYGGTAFVFSVFRSMADVSKEMLSSALNDAEIDILASFPETYNLMEAGVSGVVASDETRALLSSIHKANWANEDFRARRLLALAALHADPEFIARRIEAIREGIRTPDARAKRSKISTALWSEPEFKAKMINKKVQNWEDPEYRAKQSDGRKRSWADPESRARRLAGLKKAASDPKVRAARQAGMAASRDKMIASHKTLWEDPEYRSRQSVSRATGQERRFTDPDQRRIHSEKMKEVWAKRKAAKAATAFPQDAEAPACSEV